MSTVATNAHSAPTVVELSPEDFRNHIDEALAVYVTAMGYPRGTEFHRAPMWTEHMRRPGWRCVGAFSGDPTPELVGIAYGYSGDRHQWWYQQVFNGLDARGWDPSHINGVLGDYFELTELHVRPDAQGQGIGQSLLHLLLTNRPERGVLLSTPEVAEEGNRAWRLYRRAGFQDVLRHFRFAGDARPFAVLGRALPFAHSYPAPGEPTPDMPAPTTR
ncbi:MAG: GNAT family N-acetyltransferase [Rhodococcus sp.]|nr:GNAT family N-acetyltransferase [Rhodococcus sp. (in: high G+C Gram-positive bacteria)]